MKFARKSREFLSNKKAKTILFLLKNVNFAIYIRKKIEWDLKFLYRLSARDLIRKENELIYMKKENFDHSIVNKNEFPIERTTRQTIQWYFQSMKNISFFLITFRKFTNTKKRNIDKRSKNKKQYFHSFNEKNFMSNKKRFTQSTKNFSHSKNLLILFFVDTSFIFSKRSFWSIYNFRSFFFLDRWGNSSDFLNIQNYRWMNSDLEKGLSSHFYFICWIEFFNFWHLSTKVNSRKYQIQLFSFLFIGIKRRVERWCRQNYVSCR